MTVPEISILMPAKNAGKYLQACLDSILSQTETNWELVVVDDFSSDNTLDILNGYSANDSRIRILKNERKGIIPALRMAFSTSTGSLITRMDADDEMLPGKLSTLSTALKEKGPGFLAVGQVKYFSNEELGDGYLKYEAWLNQLISTGNNWNEIYKECVIPSPNWMVFRDDLIRAGAFNSDLYPEDYDLCFRFYESGLSPIATDVCTHRWRDHPERFSRNAAHYSDNRFLDLKVHYFLKLDHKSSMPLKLWGAGKKGKDIAKLLIKNEIRFEWYCNHPGKIGHNIYEKILRDSNQIFQERSYQLIIAVANPEAQSEIRSQIDSDENGREKRIWFFC